MASAIPRKRRSGTYWFLRDDEGHEHRCGPGRKGKEVARAWAARYNQNRVLAKAGLLPDEPGRCLWTLEDLHQAHVRDARDRGLRTSRPQHQGKASKLESHWKALLASFGPALNLDDLTETAIRGHVRDRQRKVGPVPINRELWGVLRPALRLARDTELSGYRGDPFRRLRRLDEKLARRNPVALTPRLCADFVGIAWALRPSFGAWVEMQLLTASRPGQEGRSEGGFWIYPAHKRGIPRAFPLRGRLAELARTERAFSRDLWKRAIAELGIPLRPHDLRHSALTIEGARRGSTLESVRLLGGWKSVAMADRYLHPGKKAVRAVTLKVTRGAK